MKPFRYYSGRDSDDIDQVLPWSEEYRSYEKDERLKIFDQYVPASNEKHHKKSGIFRSVILDRRSRFFLDTYYLTMTKKLVRSSAFHKLQKTEMRWVLKNIIFDIQSIDNL